MTSDSVVMMVTGVLFHAISNMGMITQKGMGSRMYVNNGMFVFTHAFGITNHIKPLRVKTKMNNFLS